MNRVLANAAALALAVALAVAAAVGGRAQRPVATRSELTVTDAGGIAVPAADYRRVVSLNVLSDPILVEILEPERLVACSSWSTGVDAFKLGARPRLRGVEEVEAILALHPDLVVVSGSGTSAVARLRAAGITVFELGDLTGWEQCARVAGELGRLVRAGERAQRLLARARARLAAVRPLPAAPRAVWVSAIGDRLYGGTIGSSYHDLLVLAGCDDVAAARYRAWPEYSLEDLLALDPDVIVTATGQGEALRRRAGAGSLRARIVELPAAVAGDPGLGLVDAVEQLRAALD